MKRIVLALVLMAALASPVLSAVTVVFDAGGTITVTSIGESDDVAAAWCRVGQMASVEGWDGVETQAEDVPLAGFKITAWEADMNNEYETIEELLEQCDDV